MIKSISPYCEQVSDFLLYPDILYEETSAFDKLIIQKRNIFGFMPYNTSVSVIDKDFISSDTSVNINTINEIEILKHIFTFYNENEIKSFLMVHSSLITPLNKLQDEIISRFGNILPKMELVTDVELPEWKTLFITIPSIDNFETAFEKLNSLICEWLFPQSKDFKKLINLTIS